MTCSCHNCETVAEPGGDYCRRHKLLERIDTEVDA